MHTNGLIDSSSPYLLQHAHNPVDWYEWSTEALERAKREDKPILLSIGYSACHWCHVMERESFENKEIARIMNEHFVCIKVDREERPDLDEIYMSAVQVMTGTGGWPLTVFLTPDLEPFYGGTYFPPDDRYGRPGFKRVLLAAAKAYREKGAEVKQEAQRLVDILKDAARRESARAEQLDATLIEEAVQSAKSGFDPTWGGFSGPPKFPQSNVIGLLLRHHARTGNDDSLKMATLTLDKMAYGGMYDQVGGGFHRYSVDREWLVPHFEKMLYDNAQLATVYIEAFQLTGKPLYERIAQETLDYVLREMTDTGGGFHSAQDADSEGEEGKYYIWKRTEIQGILGPSEADLFCEYYGFSKKGNAEGHNILHVPVPPAKFAKRRGVSLDELELCLKEMRHKVLAARFQRIPPGEDDKVLADWNGLMISAFARGYMVWGTEEYRTAAERAADFVLTHMRSESGLLHSYRGGKSYIEGYLDDYAFMINALLDLYEATFDVKWLDRAQELANEMIERFWDGQSGGFYFTSSGQTDAILRPKKAHDGATPSGNAAAAHGLLRLAKLTDSEAYLEKAVGTLGAFASSVKRTPAGFARLLSALDFHLGPACEIVVCGRSGDANTKRLLDVVRRRYLPNAIVAAYDPEGRDASQIVKRVPLLESKGPVGHEPAVYVCRDSTCSAPVRTPAELEELLVTEWQTVTQEK